MIDSVTEAQWRSLAKMDALKPKPPEYIPGLPGINLQRFIEWKNAEVFYRICRAERLIYGIPYE